MSGTLTAWVALAIALTAVSVWFRRAFAVALPENRTGFVATMVVAMLAGLTAFVQGVGWGSGVAAGLAVLLGGFFLATVAISAQKGGAGRFVVGEPVPEFTAPDDTGEPFAIASLRGNPLLLKFFRGHW